jgi:hypothetical protein
MAEEKGSQAGGPPQKPAEDGDLIGGELRAGSGGSPRLLRWITYALYVWGVLYLLVHPSIPHRVIILVFGGIIGAWLLFYSLTKRPPEL